MEANFRDIVKMHGYHTHSKEYVMWGMYDKTTNPNEKDVLYGCDIPDNAKFMDLKENEHGLHTMLSRGMFPFRKDDGTEQVYFGWYLLVPLNKKLMVLDENAGNFLDKSVLRLTDDNGNDIIFTDKLGNKYVGYGKFNIARTSDNWKMKVTVHRI